METIRHYPGAASETARNRTGDGRTCKICGRCVTVGQHFLRVPGGEIHKECVRPELKFLIGALGYEYEVKEGASE